MAHAAGPGNVAGSLELAQGAAQAPAGEPPPPKDFWIYYDSSQFNIRPDAADTLDHVVIAIKRLGRTKVTLTGHADAAGVATDDERLSKFRADEAKKYLVKQGVPADDITTVGKGRSDPRVPIPRNGHSQENRNVHIELQ
ncbi:MAG: OmpA family protein [Alphaproteobacteria bacterium]